MDILFCGTAAAEGWPALFCICSACTQARERGGKNVRTRAAYMVDDRVRIDFGPDSLYHQHTYRLDYSRLEHLLVTHSHEDHWFPSDLAYRRKGFSRVSEIPLHLWSNASVQERFAAQAGPDWSAYGIEPHLVEPFQPFSLGLGLSVVAVKAQHDRSQVCLNYILEQDGRRALIGHDTGWYDEPTWEYLAGKPLHVAALDCTYGSEDNDRGHMGAATVVRARAELQRRGALDRDARVIATHFSHNGGWLHERLEEYLVPHDIEVAWDGLTVTV